MFQCKLAVVYVYFYPKTHGICVAQGVVTISKARYDKNHPKSHKTNQIGNISAFQSYKMPQKIQLPLLLG